MATFNKVFLIGNLGKDPEFKTLQSGIEVCNFSIATTKYRKDKDPLTYWHDISAFDKLCVTIRKLNLSKGDSVHVDGELTYREYDGKKYTSIFATGIQVLTKKESPTRAKPESSPDGKESPTRAKPESSPENNDDSDLPF